MSEVDLYTILALTQSIKHAFKNLDDGHYGHLLQCTKAKCIKTPPTPPHKPLSDVFWSLWSRAEY